MPVAYTHYVDALVLRCALPVAEIGRVLLALELRGLVRALVGQRYVWATVDR